MLESDFNLDENLQLKLWLLERKLSDGKENILLDKVTYVVSSVFSISKMPFFNELPMEF